MIKILISEGHSIKHCAIMGQINQTRSVFFRNLGHRALHEILCAAQQFKKIKFNFTINKKSKIVNL